MPSKQAMIRRNLSGENGGPGACSVPLHPDWDPVRRELRVGKIVIKRFMRPAPLLERLLQEFHEFNWPREIEDPLSGRSAAEAKRRLHDAINDLNECQSPQLIRFYGNGKGDGLCWTYTAEFRAVHTAD